MKNLYMATANKPDDLYQIHQPINKICACLAGKNPFVEPVPLQFHHVEWHAFDLPLSPKQIGQTGPTPIVE